MNLNANFCLFLMTLITLLSARSVAAGVPDCDRVIKPIPLLKDQGALEAIAFDSQGKVYLSDLGVNGVISLASKTAPPEILAEGIRQPGGLAFGDSGELYVGSGNGLGGLFPKSGNANIFKLDPRTAAKTMYAPGVSMANGVVRAADGTLYASNDFARSLDRVTPDGTVEVGWLKLNSNGMALSQDGKTLYVNRSVPSRVMAVDLATQTVRGHSKISLYASSSFFDGLTIDSQDRLYVAAYLVGKIFRVEQNGKVCTLAKGMSLASAAAFGVNPQGNDDGFGEKSLYVTSHSGILYELQNVLD